MIFILFFTGEGKQPWFFKSLATMFGIWAISHVLFVFSRHLEQIPAGWSPSPVDCESWILNDHHVSSCMLPCLLYDTVKLYSILSQKIINMNIQFEQEHFHNNTKLNFCFSTQ